MGKQLVEIKDFASGLITNADTKDLPEGASTFSVNINPNSGYGVADSIYTHGKVMDLIPPITNMVIRPGLNLNDPSDLAVNISKYLINIPNYRADLGISEFYNILEKGELIPNGKFDDPKEVPSGWHTNSDNIDVVNDITDIQDLESQTGGMNYLRLYDVTTGGTTGSSFKLWIKVPTQPGFMYRFLSRVNSELAWEGLIGGSGRNHIGGRVYAVDAKYTEDGAILPDEDVSHFPETDSDVRILASEDIDYALGESIDLRFIPKEEFAFICFEFDDDKYGPGTIDTGIWPNGGHQAFISQASCKLYLGSYLFAELCENLDMSDSDRGLFVSGENIEPHIMHQAYDSDGDVSRYIRPSECTAYLSKYSITNIDQMISMPSLTGTVESTPLGEVATDSLIAVLGQPYLYRTVLDDDASSTTHGDMIIETLQGDLLGFPIGGVCNAQESSRAVPHSDYENFTTYPGALNTNATGSDIKLHNRAYVFQYQGTKIHKVEFESTNTDSKPTPKILYTVKVDAGSIDGYINGVSHSKGQDELGYHYIYFSTHISGGHKAGQTCLYAVRDKRGVQQAIPLYTVPDYMHITAYTGWSVRRNWLGMRRDVNPNGATAWYWPKNSEYEPVTYKNGSNKDEDHMTAYGYAYDVCWINDNAGEVAVSIPNNSVSTLDKFFENEGNVWVDFEKQSDSGTEASDAVSVLMEPLGHTKYLKYSGVCHKIIQNPYYIPDSWGSADGWWTHIDQHQEIEEGTQLVLVNPWKDDALGDRGIQKFELDTRPARSDDIRFNRQKMIEAIEWLKDNASSMPDFPSVPTGAFNPPSTQGDWSGVTYVTERYNHQHYSTSSDTYSERCTGHSESAGGTTPNHRRYEPNYPPYVHDHLVNGFTNLKNNIGGETAQQLLDSLRLGLDPDMSLATQVQDSVKSGNVDTILAYYNWMDTTAGYHAKPSINGWDPHLQYFNYWKRFTEAKAAIESDLGELTINAFNVNRVTHLNIASNTDIPEGVSNPNHLFSGRIDRNWIDKTLPNGNLDIQHRVWKSTIDNNSLASALSDLWDPDEQYLYMEQRHSGSTNVMPIQIETKQDSGVWDNGGVNGITSLSELWGKLQIGTGNTYDVNGNLTSSTSLNFHSGYVSDGPSKMASIRIREEFVQDGQGTEIGVHWPGGETLDILESTSCSLLPGWNVNASDYLKTTSNWSVEPMWTGQGLETSTYTGKLRSDRLAFNKAGTKDILYNRDGGGNSHVTAQWPEGISPGIVVEPGNLYDAAQSTPYYLAQNDTVMYNLSLLYDGYQEGPLLPVPVTFTYDYQTYSNQGHVSGDSILGTEVTVSVENTNPRVTHAQLYKKKDALDAWRLVGSKPIDNDWIPTGVEGAYEMQGAMSFTFTDDESTTGISYGALTGVSETLGTTMVNYEESTQAGDYLFAARADIEGMADAHKLIFRSEPGKFSIFNWPQNYVGIDEVPTALLGVQNRLYAWSDKAMYVIDPFNLIVEDRIPGKGVSSRDAVMNFNNTVVFANKTGVYTFQGQVVELSSAIKNEYTDIVKNIGNAFKIRLAHNPKHDSIMLFFDNLGTASLDKVPTDVFVYTMKNKRWDRWRLPSKVKSVAISEDNTCLLCAESDAVVSYSESGKPLDKDGNELDSYAYSLYEVHEGAHKEPMEFKTKRFTMNQDSRLKKFKKIKLTGEDVYISRVEIDGLYRDYTEDDAEVENKYLQTLDLKNTGTISNYPDYELYLDENGVPLIENPNNDFNLTGNYISFTIKSKASTTDIDDDTGEEVILRPDSKLESIGIIFSMKAIK